MSTPQSSAATELAAILAELESRGSGTAELRARLEAALRDVNDASVLRTSAAPYLQNPDVVAPLYERVIELEPADAHALVVLANAWWLQGRGPVAVGELATRALTIDPSHRGAWHLWALSESDPRRRVQRWQQVAERFPQDDLALAAVADNAAAVAGAERDYEMLDFSIATFERLLERATEPAQREAVTAALTALRGWRL